MSIIYFIKFY